MKTIIIDGVEYETETHDFNKRLEEIKIPEGWRLWKSSECFRLWEDEKLMKQFNLEECWFYVWQPINNTDCVAGFYAYSDGADLYCDWDPTDTNAALGVRFARDVKK